MEKTKKLFTYAVVFVAIVTLFVAGIAAQTVPSYAAEISTSWKEKGAPEVKTEDIKIIVNGTEQNVTADQIKNFVTWAPVAGSVNEDKIANFVGELTNKDSNLGINEELDKIAKDIDPAYDRNVMEIAYTFEITKVEADSVDLTFKVAADIVLFKGFGAGDAWEILYPVSANNASNAAGIYAAGESNVTIQITKPGVVVIEKVSEKAAADAKSGAGKTEGKHCTCCSDSCPFCSFLCKDGVCYCWSMYVVIVLGAILIVLLIALIIVKAKAKKVVDVQQEPVEAPEAEEAKPEEGNNDQQ